MTHFVFSNSAFLPIVIGFFGLGTGYFIWGGQALFGYPQSSPEVNRTMGMWGFWASGCRASCSSLPVSTCWLA